MRATKQNEFVLNNRWTTGDRIWGCKNFFDHYNATPSLEATIAGSEALKSDLIFLIVFEGYSLL